MTENERAIVYYTENSEVIHKRYPGQWISILDGAVRYASAIQEEVISKTLAECGDFCVWYIETPEEARARLQRKT